MFKRLKKNILSRLFENVTNKLLKKCLSCFPPFHSLVNVSPSSAHCTNTHKNVLSAFLAASSSLGMEVDIQYLLLAKI
jgi:hypothetical protein